MDQSGVQIVSDGTVDGTHVLLDGRALRGVTNVRWEIGVRSRRARLVLEIDEVEIDAQVSVDDETREQLNALQEGLPVTARP